MRFQFANRASATLAAPVTPENTSLTLAPGTGNRFPSPTGDAPMQLAIVSPTGASETVRCHSRAGDVLQDLWRGQEGSAVISFQVGALVELRLTTDVLNNFLQIGGGEMAGDIGMNNHTIHNANLDGSPYIENVKTHGVFPPDFNFATAIEMISGGVTPRINSYSILTTIMLHSAIFMWWGRLDQLPPWLKVCDGSQGTPDLRSRFVLGADDDSNIGWSGGTWQQSTYGAGGHNHSGATQNQTLGAGNLPGLTAPSLSVTNIALLKQSLSANFPNDPKFNVVEKVSMAGGGTYSGTRDHAHGINWADDHQHLFDTASPYFRLHFVMFRSMQIT